MSISAMSLRVAAAAFLCAPLAATTSSATASATAESCTAPEIVRVVRHKDTEITNYCPSARAGLDLTVPVDRRVTLDASGSADYDGDALRFAWTLVQRPAGSGANLESATTMRPSLTVDLAGTYIAEVTVTDARGARSTDQVRIDTANSAPLAWAGRDRSVARGDTVTLDAGGSQDFDGDTLRYEWELVAPESSAARLDDPYSATPSFVVDVDGDYQARLIANDGRRRSLPDAVQVTTGNLRPSAQAGSSRVFRLGDVLDLDGSGSSDFESTPLAYRWSVLAAPESSAVKMRRFRSQRPLFTPDATGLYLLQLVVGDGELLSEPDTLVLDVREARPMPLADAVREVLQRFPELGAADADGDGVSDPADNCVNEPNANQTDTDTDGIGNACDADVNNDGIVDFADLNALKLAFFTSPGSPGWDPNLDFNGDDIIDFFELNVMKLAFFLPPGPPGTLTWINGAGGAWDIATNWSPTSVPASGVSAIINLDPDVTVTIGSNVAAAAGTVILDDNLVIAGGSLTGANIPIGAGSLTVTTADATLDGVTIGVDTTLQNGAIVTVLNNLQLNNASVNIQGTSIPTGLEFPGLQTIFGFGDIVFASNFNGAISEPRVKPIGAGSMLTIGAGIRVRGNNGTLGDPTLPLDVQGQIRADVSGATIEASGAPLALSDTSRGGGSTLQVIAGANLRFGGTVQTDATGVVVEVDGNWWLGGGSFGFASLSSARFDGTTGSTLTVPISDGAMNDVILNHDLTMQNGGVVTVTNGLTINGNVSIQGTSVPTGLDFDGDQSFDGNATVSFDSNFNGALAEPRVRATAGTLTIGANVLFRGNNGTVGNPALPLNLAGTVQADVGGAEIQVVSSAGRLLGPLTSINGSRLRLRGEFDSSVVRRSGGPTPGMVPLDSTTGTLIIDNGATVANAIFDSGLTSNVNVPSTDATFDNLTLNNVSLVMDNGAEVTVLNDLTLNGSAEIRGTSVVTGLQFDGTQTFGGTADVLFASNFNGAFAEPQIRSYNSSTLTIGPNVTIHGNNGQIGAPGETTILQGSITTDVNAATIYLRGTYSATGTLAVENGGRMALIDTFDNGGQPVTVTDNGGSFLLNSAAAGTLEILDTTINASAGAFFTMSSLDAVFDGVTFNGDIDMTLANGALVTVRNGLTLNGDVSITGTTIPTGFQFDGTQTLDGAGTYTFASNFNGAVNEPQIRSINGSTLTIETGITVRGNNGTIGAAGETTIIRGDVASEVNGTQIRLAGNYSATSELRADAGGKIVLTGAMDNGGAGVSIDATGTNQVLLGSTAAGTVSVANTVFNAAPDSTFIVSSVDATFDAVTFDNADLTLLNGALVTVTNGLTVSGAVTIAGTTLSTGFLFDGTQTFGGTADIAFAANFNGVVAEPQITPTNGGTLTIGVGISITGDRGTVGSNSLPLVINGDIEVSGTSQIIEVDGSTVTLNTAGSLSAVNNGTLNVVNLAPVQGTLRTHGGSLNHSPGITMAGSGVLDTRISGVAANQFGTLDIDGAAALSAGTLNIALLDGFSPEIGQEFVVVTYDSLTSQFGAVSGSGGGTDLQRVYNANDLTLVGAAP